MYRLSDAGMDAPTLAERMARVIAALESRLGPFPYPSYGIAEAPDDIKGWYAASQQTFIVARASAFGYDHGNTPLWAHEASHAWWGNLISAEGEAGLMVSEALAQLGVLIALETTEGDDATARFLEFSRSGYNSLQSAAGYFHIWRQGGDKPLSELADDRWDHNLSDSKGMWVYHMLRHRVGDRVFFGVLRDIIQQRRGGAVSLADLRAFFLRASDDPGLAEFFAQWLDRAGAPVLDLDWWATRDPDGTRGVHLEIAQTQGGEPFTIDLEIGIELDTGERITRTIALADARHSIDVATGGGRPVRVELDPRRLVLMWRPAYGPRPEPTAD
ncbi:MAG: hypothetical protein D6693_01830 [Planctomycetota bacterium]|nr:MAG: hypothetical protein D6693_01830 [Planctomycetota bacterium]